MIKLFSLAIVLFASSNIDDIFVLVAFFADVRFGATEIIAGQYAGIILLVGISVAASLSSAVLPLPYMGLVAVVPIVVGVGRLFELFNERTKTEVDSGVPPNVRGHRRTATVALVTLMNGADNIGIYTPAFAIRSRTEITLIVMVFMVMTAVWCLVARWLVNHPSLGAPIRRYGRVLAPAVLIALGIDIMFRAATFALLGRMLHSGT